MAQTATSREEKQQAQDAAALARFQEAQAAYTQASAAAKAALEARGAGTITVDELVAADDRAEEAWQALKVARKAYHGPTVPQ
jgi:hypothetical protein